MKKQQPEKREAEQAKRATLTDVYVGIGDTSERDLVLQLDVDGQRVALDVSAWADKLRVELNKHQRRDGPEPTGLYRKYRVEKTDGSPVDRNAQYLVLRIDTDEHARKAALAYAKAVRSGNEDLATEITSWVRTHTPCGCREEQCPHTSPLLLGPS